MRSNWFWRLDLLVSRNFRSKSFWNADTVAVTGFLAIFLNLILAEEIEDETVSITANDIDAANDREEWKQIQHKKMDDIEDDVEKGKNSDGQGVNGEK